MPDEVYEVESGEYTADPLQRGVLAQGCSSMLECLHADNGAIQNSSTLRAKMEWLGIEPAYSRPRVSNDNAFSESLFRTKKYRPDFPHDGFVNLEKVRTWCATFVQWYNKEHKHSAIKFVTPVERHRGDDVQILAKRDELYRKAKATNPSGWSGNTRNWQRLEVIVLNPDKEEDKLEKAA